MSTSRRRTPTQRGWRQFRWVRRWATASELPPAVAAAGADLDDQTERLAGESRTRRITRMTRRDRLVTSVVATGFVVAAAATALIVPTDRTLDPFTCAALVALFAVASRLDFEVGTGSAVPTALALVPMLFLLPLGQVPLWVAAGYVLGAAPDYLRRTEHPERSLVLVCSSWYALGPTLVLAIAGEGPPRLDEVPLYVAALGAQFAFDAASACGRDGLVHRVPLRDLARYLGWAFLGDLLLAPVALAVAIAAHTAFALLLLTMPLLALIGIFARERRARVDQALELSAAYSGTGRLAETYHEILSEQTLGSALDRIADTLTELTGCDYVSFTPAGADRPLLDRGSASGAGATFTTALSARGTHWGTLTLRRSGDRPFGADERQLVSWFGDAAALALDSLQLRETLRRQAQTDSLTGLLNHGTFQARLAGELSAARSGDEPVSLLMLDIDNFKRINDIHGHDVGDTVLEVLAELLRGAASAGDHCCRVGGEELALVLPGTRSEEALAFAIRLQLQLATRPIEPVGAVTISVGIAEAPVHARSPRELIARAEQAMMTAKAEGKNAAIVYESVAMTRPDDELGGRRDRNQRSIAHLRMLQGLIGRLHRLHDEDEIAVTIGDELRRLIDHDGCRLYRADGGELVPLGRSQGHARPAPEVEEAIAVALGQRQSVLVQGLRDRSVAVVPLVEGGDAIAVIAVEKDGAGRLDEDDVHLLELLANHAAVALGNAHRYAQSRRRNEELEAESRTVIEGFGLALAARDAETADHAQATAALAHRLGRALGLDPDALERLELGAQLHDVGKIGIPAGILAKAGPLTPDERRVVETHVEIGERILSPISRFDAIRPIVRHSHERWDGTGYPDRLAGADIPLEARIVAVVDAYHAMTSDRPYRQCLGSHQACEELRRNAGTQFDPLLVDTFLTMLQDELFDADDLVA